MGQWLASTHADPSRDIYDHAIAMGAPKLHVDVDPFGDAIAVVSIVHGAGEHCGRYAELRRALWSSGIATATMDLRGHGLSSGDRLDVREFDEYAEDCTFLRELVDSRRGGIPHFLLGHSMGSLVVLRSATQRPEGVAGIALLSVPVRPSRRLGRLLLELAPFLAAVAPRLRLSLGIDPEDLTRDAAAQEAARADALRLERGTTRWGAALRAAMSSAVLRAASLTQPLLVLHGKDDPIVGVDGARAVFDAAASSDKTLLTYDALHELILEVPSVRQAVFRDLAAWFRARAPGAG